MFENIFFVLGAFIFGDLTALIALSFDVGLFATVILSFLKNCCVSREE